MALRRKAARHRDDANGRSVMVMQMGARRNYVYARQLEAAGLLHSLVCDAAWPTGMLSWPVRLARRVWPRLAGPIERRTVAEIHPSRLSSTILPNIASATKLILHQEHAFTVNNEVLGLSARLGGLDDVKVIVNYIGNGGSFLDYARRRGVRIVTDFISHPRYWQIVGAEQALWRGWEPEETVAADDAHYRKRIDRLLTISDIYLCPSTSVASALSGLPGFDAARVRIVPYGISGVVPRPAATEHGRVLFAASKVSVTKGLPYLAKAAAILGSQQAGIDLVIAGSVSPALRARAELANLTFLGPLDRDRMAEEFARADVFCLPSLAEGSATSIYEALANGVPVVTTASSGSVITDGLEGFIVPERDGPAIAAAVKRIVTNRSMRHAMSAAARATAARYSDEACGEQFIAVIREVLDSSRALGTAENAG